jgi:hypothetical protein
MEVPNGCNTSSGFSPVEIDTERFGKKVTQYMKWMPYPYEFQNHKRGL